MFLIHLEDASAVSAVGNSSNPSYNPIYLELDSTDPSPSPSPWVKCLLSLPAGHVCLRDGSGLAGGAVVSFQGTTANYWRVEYDQNGLVQGEGSSQIRLDVNNNLPTAFWVRSNTVFEEVPVDDRTVALKVSGKVEKV